MPSKTFIRLSMAAVGRPCLRAELGESDLDLLDALRFCGDGAEMSPDMADILGLAPVQKKGACKMNPIMRSRCLGYLPRVLWILLREGIGAIGMAEREPRESQDARKSDGWRGCSGPLRSDDNGLLRSPSPKNTCRRTSSHLPRFPSGRHLWHEGLLVAATRGLTSHVFKKSPFSRERPKYMSSIVGLNFTGSGGFRIISL